MTPIPILDDFKSWLHVLLGIFISYEDSPLIALSAIGLFTAYQLRESENMRNKVGDFVELNIGMAVGYGIRELRK